MMHLLTAAKPGLHSTFFFIGQKTFMQPWTEALLKRLTIGSVHAGPMDPNPAISAHAVFPQSGHIRPEKGRFSENFHIFPK